MQGKRRVLIGKWTRGIPPAVIVLDLVGSLLLAAGLLLAFHGASSFGMAPGQARGLAAVCMLVGALLVLPLLWSALRLAAARRAGRDR